MKQLIPVLTASLATLLTLGCSSNEGTSRPATQKTGTAAGVNAAAGTAPSGTGGSKAGAADAPGAAGTGSPETGNAPGAGMAGTAAAGKSGASAGSGSSGVGNASSNAGNGNGSGAGDAGGTGNVAGNASGGTGNSAPVGPADPHYDCNWGAPVITTLAPSTSPPGGLAMANVPQFVAFGFDDNRYEDGLQWALDTIKSKQNPLGKGNHCSFDGTGARFTFYVESKITDNTPELSALHLRAHTDGNEVGNHTNSHDASLQGNTDKALWASEMNTCDDYLSGLGIPRSTLVGFRTPFLGYTSATYDAMGQVGFKYDCSVQAFLTGTGEEWPYTLDNGQSSNSYPPATGKHPGIWELPVHEFMPATGWSGLTGLDWNIWCGSGNGKPTTPAGALALLKASLDLRFKGDTRAPANRAPLFVGMHSDLYSVNNTDATACMGTVAERRQVIEQFVDWVLAYDPAIRLVPMGQVVNWMQAPVGLDGTRSK